MRFAFTTCTNKVNKFTINCRSINIYKPLFPSVIITGWHSAEIVISIYRVTMLSVFINGYAVLQKMCTTVYGGLFSWARFLPKDRVSVVPKQFSDVLDGNFVDDCV